MINLRPTYLIDGDLTYLELSLLQQDGIRGLILDLDNTIMCAGEGIFSAEILAWFQEAQRLGFQMIVVTNNTNNKYLSKVAKLVAELGLEMLTHAGKPHTRKILQATKLLEVPLEQICLIGDRVLTDVWGGSKAQIKTALVRPLLGERENLLYRWLREIEYLCLAPLSRYKRVKS